MLRERTGTSGAVEQLSFDEFLLDTTKTNQRYAATNHDPRRKLVGTYKVPRDVNVGQFQGISRESCNKFVDVLDKKGWTLISKLRVAGPFPAHDLDTGIALLDRHEYRVEGLFQLRDPKPVRIEIPGGLVRQHDEQRITLKEALNA